MSNLAEVIDEVNAEAEIKAHVDRIFAPLEASIERVLKLLGPTPSARGYCREHNEAFSELCLDEWMCESCIKAAEAQIDEAFEEINGGENE